MTVLDLLRALRRHPVVLLACLVAAANAGIAVWLGVPTSYQSDSSLVLLSPETVIGTDGKPVKINPWDRAGDTPSQVMASALSSVASSPAFVEDLEKKGVTSATAVEVALTGGGVVLNLTTVNQDSASAVADMRTLSEEIKTTLAARQRDVGAPANSLLRAEELTQPGPPLVLSGDRVKLAGITVVLGLILSVLFVQWVDFRERRRRRQEPLSWSTGLRPRPVAKEAAAATQSAAPKRQAAPEPAATFSLADLDPEATAQIPAKRGLAQEPGTR